MKFRPHLGGALWEDNTMIIRKARLDDIDEMMKIYDAAREFMRSVGNASQWGNGYPSRETIESDIHSEYAHVLEDEGEIIATFFFKIGVDKTYLRIVEGEWLNNREYGVIHRIAIKNKGRGTATHVYNYCYELTKNLKIDTHKDNLPMQKSLLKNGFKRCGIIYLENGDERIAYQKAE